MPVFATRFALSLSSLVHVFLALGFGFGVGPVQWDPANILVRGQPATLEPGLELAFPCILAAFYASLSAGLIYAIIRFTPDAIQASAIPCLMYHFAAFTYTAASGDSGITNPDKMDVKEPLIGHCILWTLSAIAFVTARSSGNATMVTDKAE